MAQADRNPGTTWLVAGAGAAALIVVVVLLGRPRGGPQPGETVTPVVVAAPTWFAGRDGHLAVRLTAGRGDGEPPRSLDFAGLPADVNPVADIAYYEDDQPLTTGRVSLSHRC